MPVISTLGALTTFKGTESSLYWAVTFEVISALVVPMLSTFVESNNSISLGGRITTTTAGQPQYIKLSTGSTVPPTILYSAFYGSNANTEGRFVDSVFDNTNNRTILIGQQEANISGNVVDCGLVRVLNANNSSFSAFLDPPTPAVATNDRIFNSAVLNANGSITAAGFLRRDPTFQSEFITNYSQTGTRNWSKKLTGTIGLSNVHAIVSNNILVSGSETSSNTAFGYLLPNGSSFTTTFGIQDFSLNGDIAIDTSNNLYVGGGTKLIKYDAAGNSIGWVKEIVSSNNFFGSSAFYNGNIYSLIRFTPAFQKDTTRIISINANTGAVNWQNNLSIAGANTGFGLTDISVNDQGIFALGSYTDDINAGSSIGSILLKLPFNGDIPGTGSYGIGNAGLTLNIATSNITITNGSANLISSNIGVANANAVSTITTSIAANTTQNYTFSDTILK